MPITVKAPYAPVNTVLKVVEGFRDRGLKTPFTADVLERAGVPVTLAPRTLQSLKLLDLVTDEGEPTSELLDLRTGTDDEYKERLAAGLKATYAEVFQFADPATDDYERVYAAFRSYQPQGQRDRMVTLFYALCEYAGIIKEVPEAQRGAINRTLKARGASKGYSRKAKTLAKQNQEGKAKPSDDRSQKDPPLPPPPSAPTLDTAKSQYLAILLKLAESDPSPEVLNRIERVLGVDASPTNAGGESG